MRIGLMGNEAYSVAGSGPFDVEGLIADAQRAAADGFSSYWIGQQMDWDAIALICAMGREVPDIELGTAVSHVWTSFPVHMAQSAMSAHHLTGGRFCLGIGLEHEWVMREMWGLPFERPVSLMAEYLDVLVSLIRTGAVDCKGEFYQISTFFPRFEPEPTLPVILAALGPRMLGLAGAVADGTVTWMTGLNTVRDHIVPTIHRAASEADRPEPRVIVLLPIALTSDEPSARAAIAQEMAMYERMPSYQAMLEREGATTGGDIALAGSAGQLLDGLEALREAGATDFGAILLGPPGLRAATYSFLCDVRDQFMDVPATLGNDQSAAEVQ